MKQFEELQQRTKRFALRILKLYRSLPKNDECRILGKQILRSGTSIGANYRAACRLGHEQSSSQNLALFSKKQMKQHSGWN
jgi:four helix bundle protein